MGQQEILDELEKNDLTIKEIYERLNNISQVAIRVAIHQLLKYQEIEKKYLEGKPPRYKLKKLK